MHRSYPALKTLLGLAACLSLGGTARADLVTYNSPADLTAQFSINVADGSAPSVNSSGGLSGSGGVNAPAAVGMFGTTAVYTGSSFGFAVPGSTVVVSQFFQAGHSNANQTPFAMIGLLSDSTERMDNGVASFSYASIRLMPSTVGGDDFGQGIPVSPTSGTTGLHLQTETKVNGGTRVRTDPLAPIDAFGTNAVVVDGNWYYVEATFTNLSASQISITAALYDASSSGALGATLFNTGALTINLSGLDQINGDGTVFAGWRTFANGGVTVVDAFSASAVPEPGAVWLMIGAAAVGAGVFRRRFRVVASPSPSAV